MYSVNHHAPYNDTTSYLGATDDLAHSIAESIEYVAAIEEISLGDMLFMGTNHQGLGAMQDGDTIEVGVEGVGRFTFTVSDPLKLRWAKGVD